ncbi:uncharacterized protein PHALS_12259 [Plasmopara halstedii]|uniref:Uncharacterized protein n=1 Tax=Plasmopara halstedii TaxID=4781 RepID=A0A0P1ALB2_PLAHL|nr:uncharacterized protein PHALS_12259 [Plasmopara halstedii]CEG41948.1 hypothetical protein PHALS_12259 [Plasmopara halstedii]|eukprot:XP_024578317.1 hypothetical protein PHALS_12259 [Plasmopara halstedii]
MAIKIIMPQTEHQRSALSVLTVGVHAIGWIFCGVPLQQDFLNMRSAEVEKVADVELSEV